VTGWVSNNPGTNFFFVVFCDSQCVSGGGLTRLHTRSFVIILAHKNEIYVPHFPGPVPDSSVLNALKQIYMEMITNVRKATMNVTETCKERQKAYKETNMRVE
jgi:hypothetical protein